MSLRHFVISSFDPPPPSPAGVFLRDNPPGPPIAFFGTCWNYLYRNVIGFLAPPATAQRVETSTAETPKIPEQFVDLASYL